MLDFYTIKNVTVNTNILDQIIQENNNTLITTIHFFSKLNPCTGQIASYRAGSHIHNNLSIGHLIVHILEKYGKDII